jgi:hypothetical protein
MKNINTKHQINIYYKDSLLFSDSFQNIDEAKKMIGNRIKNFPISLTSLIKKGNIQLQFEDFVFEYEELRQARLKALESNLKHKPYVFWVHNFMNLVPSFKVKTYRTLLKGLFNDYEFRDDYIGTKVFNHKYGYTFGFQITLKTK